MRYRVTVEGRSFDIEVDNDRLVRVNGRSLYVDLEQVGGLPLYSLAFDDEGYVVFVEEGLDEYRVEVRGEVYPVEVQRQRPQLRSRPVECDGEGACRVICAPLAWIRRRKAAPSPPDPSSTTISMNSPQERKLTFAPGGSVWSSTQPPLATCWT